MNDLQGEMQNEYDYCSHAGYIKTQSHIPNRYVSMIRPILHTNSWPILIGSTLQHDGDLKMFI